MSASPWLKFNCWQWEMIDKLSVIMSIFFLFQMSICTMCVQYPQSPKEGIVSARTGLIGNCELPDVGIGN